MRVWKQWNDENRTTRSSGSGRRKVTTAHDDRHMLRMAVNDRTASSRQLAARWSTAIGVLMSTCQFIDICCNVTGVQACLYTGSPHGKSSMAASAMGS
ncbi:transposable element Tcb2 transposase [Trichonephila clavipes]|nr:transposable element Tcb2 transposase [Trichonephila clavipes]